VIFFIDTNKSNKDYGVSLNKDRIKKGIPIVENNFYKMVGNDLSKIIVYNAKVADFKKPFHSSKEIFLDSNNNILFEVDHYMNNVTELPNYLLIIKNDYNKRNPSLYRLITYKEIRKYNENLFIAQDDTISKFKFDSIIKAWGIK
jgi:hypothetical protein